MPTQTTHPKPVLKPGLIYYSDSGRTICLKCAGTSARYSGHDVSGQKVEPAPWEDTLQFVKELGKPLSCEAGCLIYDPAGPSEEFKNSWAHYEASRPPSLSECTAMFVELKPMLDYYHEREGCPESLRQYRDIMKRLDNHIRRGGH